MCSYESFIWSTYECVLDSGWHVEVKVGLVLLLGVHFITDLHISEAALVEEAQISLVGLQ